MRFQRPAAAAGSWRVAASALRLGVAIILLPAILAAQAPGSAGSEPAETDRSAAYYHFALGHLYHQLAQQFMRDEYVTRAEEEYQAARRQDPQSVVIRTEMINLYAGAGQLPKAEALAGEVLGEDPDNVEVLRLMGRIYRTYASKPRRGWDEGLLDKSIRSFERVVELEPDKAENHVDLGLLHRAAGRLPEAEAALRKALEIDPGQADTEATLANLLLQTGKHREAIEVLERVIEGDAGGNPRHMDLLASAYQQVGRFRDAAALLEQLAERGGNLLQIRNRLADSLFRSRQFERALEEYQALAEADPSNVESFLRVSQIQQQLGDHMAAWEALDAARQIDADHLQVQFQAISLLEADGRLEEAAEAVLEVLEAGRKPEYAPAEKRRRVILLDSRGRLLRQLDRHEEAVRAYREIGRLNPDARPGVLAEIVETWRSAGDFTKAERTARSAAAEFEDNLMLSLLLANVLSDLNKTKEAVRVVERRFEDGKPDIDGLLTMARIYERGRQFSKAEAQIDSASELAETDAERIGVLFAYGSLHERAKRYDQAEVKFRELLEKDPENAGALNYLGYMWADLGVRLDEAHELIQKALDIEPDNGAYLDSLGWVYYRQNKLDLAAQYLERSVKQYADDPVVHSHLGDVYFSQGRTEDAQRHWNRAIREWTRSAPAERDGEEIASLKRKLAGLKVSLAGSRTNSKK